MSDRPYTVWINALHAERLEGQLKTAQINKAALIRRAIADVPLDVLIRAGVGPARSRWSKPGELVRVSFTIDEFCRQKIDAMTAAGFQPSDLIRAALEPYFERDLEDLQQVPDIFTTREQRRLESLRAAQEEKSLRAPAKRPPPGDAAFSRAEIVREASEESLKRSMRRWAGGKPTPAPQPAAPELAEAITAPPVPIRGPAIDWSAAGPVQPRPGLPTIDTPGLRPAREPATEDPDPFDGLDLEPAGPAPVPDPPPVSVPAQLSALDVLRKLKKG